MVEPSTTAQYSFSSVISYLCATASNSCACVIRVAHPDLHYLRKLDPYPHLSVKLNPDKISITDKIHEQDPQWRAADAHNGGLEAQNGVLEGL